MIYLSNDALHNAIEICQNKERYIVGVVLAECRQIELIFDKIKDADNVIKIHKTKTECVIYFVNNSYIRIIAVNNYIRGYAFHLLIVDKNINNKIINNVLRPLEKTYQDEELNTIQKLVWELKEFAERAPQIDLIKQKYPYLLGYIAVKDIMDFTDDIATIRDIGKKLVKDPHCPCVIKKTDDTICPCLPCRTMSNCHCGMFKRLV